MAQNQPVLETGKKRELPQIFSKSLAKILPLNIGLIAIK